MSNGVYLKKLKEVKSFLYRGPGGVWVSATTLKCMSTSYVKEQINNERLEMPWVTNHALSYLLKENLVEIRPTQAGRELVKNFLKSYKVTRGDWEEKVEGRRCSRQIAYTGTFSLDEVVPYDDHVDVKGHYGSQCGNITVEASSRYKYIKLRLQKNNVRTYVQRGSLYNKIVTDITRALMAPEGRMWIVKVGVDRVKRFLSNHVIEGKNRVELDKVT